IPLYAIGVFLSFTMTQTGAVVRWWKISRLKPGQVIKTQGSELHADPHWHYKMAINAVGALASAVVMVIFAWTKSPEGAWIVVFLVPTLVFIFFRIHHHYRRVAAELSLRGKDIEVCERPVKTILLVDDVHAATLRMVNFVQSTHEHWEAVHIAINPERVEPVVAEWRR